MAAVQSDRIIVKGEIYIGRAHELVQKVARPSPEAMFFDTGMPMGMAPIEYTPLSSQPGALPMEKLTYSLEPRREVISISDDGLVASYGIFGAPGSGKTFLLLQLLRQILALNKEDPEMKFGALILDPKAALIEDITKIAKETGRLDDLVIINTDRLNDDKETINIIHADMDSYELGKQLVQAAQAAGVATSDPYWILAWANIFGATAYLLSLGTHNVTLKDVMEYSLTINSCSGEDGSRISERLIQTLARTVQRNIDNLPSDQKQDARMAIDQLNNYFLAETKELSTIENIIRSAYNDFLRAKYSCFSKSESKDLAKQRPPFYDQVIEEGKIILFSMSPAEPNIARTLCTLVKCLFQRSVLSRLGRVQSGRLKNFKRPVLLACDEYSQVASELVGQSMGDGDFFSQSRQNGCMGILATQSVNVLRATSLKENWRSVFSNFGAKIFMRLADNETTEEATKLAGESDWYLTTMGTSRSKDGLSSSEQRDMRERKTLPSIVPTQVFQKGDAVIIGSLDGIKTRSIVQFIHVLDSASVEAIRRERDAK